MTRDWRTPRAAAALGLALSVCACVETGDFGRPTASVWNSGLAGAGWYAAAARGEAVSGALLTDDEQELRTRSYRFRTPPQAGNGWTRVTSDAASARLLPGAAGALDGPTYWDSIASAPDRSPRARYQRVREDAEADRQLIDPFAAVACRVAETDRVRLSALDRTASLAPDERADAANRVDENRRVVAEVRVAILEREAAYRYALDRLVVESPDRDAVKAERALAGLAAGRRSLERCSVTPPPLATARSATFFPRTEKELPPK